MELPIIALAGSAAVAAALVGLGFGRALFGRSIAVRGRLAALEQTPLAVAAEGSGHTHRPRRWPAWVGGDRVTRRLFGRRTRERRDGAWSSMQWGDGLVVALAVAAGCAVVAVGIGLASGREGWPTHAVLGAAIGLVLSFGVQRWRGARRARRIERQLVEFCDATATMLSTGYGYLQALRTAAEQVGGPLGTEVQRFLDEVSLGAEFDQALGDLTARLADRDFEVIATALSVQRRTGGNLGEILRGVALTIRDRQSFHRELRTLTARERFSAVIVAVFPLLLVVLLTALLPDIFGRLFTQPAGRIILAVALCLDAVGYLVARRVATLEV